MARQSFDSNDLRDNRVTGGLGYLIFFLPLILCPSSRYGRYCANQGLLIALAAVVIWFATWLVTLLLGWIPLLGGILRVAFWLVRFAVSLFAIYLTYLACAKGDARAIPGIGHISIIK